MRFNYQAPYIIDGYNYEMLIYPLYARCPSCGVRVRYEGLEYEVCPNGNYSEGHFIHFHPISVLRLALPSYGLFPNINIELRQNCVECNYCKKLLKIGEHHDCPLKDHRTVDIND